MKRLARSTKTEHRLRQRARIVLLAADGLATRAIGRAVGCTTGTASKWRVRYAEKRLAGLDETGDRGAEPKYTAADGQAHPGAAGCSRRRRAMRAGRGRCLRRRSATSMCSMSGASCARRRSTLPGANPGARATIPSSSPRPPTWSGSTWRRRENAIVICVDEKPSIQALERAQGYLKLPNGRALTGHSHDYKRNGTSTLFAAFDVATGKVTAAHKKRRRRVEFLDFMNDIVAAYPDTAIHVVLDNLNTHKPKNDRWLKRHPNVRFHFTPTRASWLNQVEIWFSILQGQVPARRFLHLGQTAPPAHRCLHRGLQRERQALRLDQSQSLPEAPQAPFRINNSG